MTRERLNKMQRVLDTRQTDLRLFLEEVHKPHNLSAIVRTCDAVGVHHLHAVLAKGQYRCHPNYAAGSHRWVNVHVHEEVLPALEQLKREGHRLMAAHLSEQAVDFRQVDYTEPCVIIMGTEKLGISEEVAEIADEHIVVPMLGLGQSLNVSVATAVILYEAQRQRWEKGCYERGTTIDPETYRTTLFEWMQPKLTRYCKQKGIPYPNIDEDGDVVDHELTQAAREAKSVEEKPDETDHTNLGS